MQEIQETLRSLQNPKVNNKPVLGVNVLEHQRARNGGYPLHMYHESLDPVAVLNEDQEQAMAERGYVRHYVRREYPKWKFRRNLDPKFQGDDYVEARLVRSREAEQDLLKHRGPQGCGPWVNSALDIEPLPDSMHEPAEVKIARLEGELQALREKKAK